MIGFWVICQSKWIEFFYFQLHLPNANSLRGECCIKTCKQTVIRKSNNPCGMFALISLCYRNVSDIWAKCAQIPQKISCKSLPCMTQLAPSWLVHHPSKPNPTRSLGTILVLIPQGFMDFPILLMCFYTTGELRFGYSSKNCNFLLSVELSK